MSQRFLLLLGFVAALLAGPVVAAAQRAPDLRPDLVISAFSVRPVRVGRGEVISYTVEAKNIGGLPCNQIKLRVTLPQGATVSSSGGASCSDRVCEAGPFTLLPGATVSATIRAKSGTVGTLAGAAAEVDPGNVCDEASETNNRGASKTVTVIDRPDLEVTLAGPTTAAAQTDIQYTAAIKNKGAGTANDVRIMFDFQANEAGWQANDPVQSMAAFASCFTSASGDWARRMECNKGTIKPGETVKVSVRARTPKSAPFAILMDAIVSTVDETVTNNNSGQVETQALP